MMSRLVVARSTLPLLWHGQKAEGWDALSPKKKFRQLVAGSDGYARCSPFDDSPNNENFTCSCFRGITMVDATGCLGCGLTGTQVVFKSMR